MASRAVISPCSSRRTVWSSASLGDLAHAVTLGSQCPDLISLCHDGGLAALVTALALGLGDALALPL
jgi:hypothetical protein